MSPKLTAIAVFFAVSLLASCGEKTSDTGGKEGGGSAVTAEQHSRSLTPSEPALMEIYNRSCRNCHTIAATGAPLTGDVQAWASRLDKGMDTLLNNVINGFASMPPLGLCMDCDDEQFEALIRFMVGGAAAGSSQE